MNPTDNELSEQDRIRAVYRDWHGGKELAPYAWHRPEVMEQDAARNRVGGHMLARTIGHDLAAVKAVDVGCGSGGFLRQLISWGARPSNLAGTEYQQDRIEQARAATASGVRWHVGDLDVFDGASFDLAVANTVFSSILDDGMRHALAAGMWRVLRPGGWCMVFDFRYNSPNNRHVRKVARAEPQAWWPQARATDYRTLLLAPPIARRLSGAPRLASELLATFVPPLRSHFIYMAQKP